MAPPCSPPRLTYQRLTSPPPERVPRFTERMSRSPSESMSANSMSRVVSAGMPAKSVAVESTKVPSKPPCAPPRLMKMRLAMGIESPPLPTSTSRSPSLSTSPKSMLSLKPPPNEWISEAKLRPGCRSVSCAPAGAAKIIRPRVALMAALFRKHFLVLQSMLTSPRKWRRAGCNPSAPPPHPPYQRANSPGVLPRITAAARYPRRATGARSSGG